MKRLLNCFENVCREHPRHTDSLFHKGIELAELEDMKMHSKFLINYYQNIRIIANVQYAKARSLAELDQIEQSMEFSKKML